MKYSLKTWLLATMTFFANEIGIERWYSRHRITKWVLETLQHEDRPMTGRELENALPDTISNADFRYMLSAMVEHNFVQLSDDRRRGTITEHGSRYLQFQNLIEL